MPIQDCLPASSEDFPNRVHANARTYCIPCLFQGLKNLVPQLGDITNSGWLPGQGATRVMSGCIQDWEHTRHLGACGALTDLQKGTQGEHVPAECLSRNEKKAAFSFYLSLTIYNGWVTQRKELNKKKVVTHYCQ